MMEGNRKKEYIVYCLLGLIPVVWFALLIAPYLSAGGLPGLLAGLGEAMAEPMNIEITEDSLKAVLIFILIYAAAVFVFISTLKNYRRGIEHGSAKWGEAQGLNAKYAGF